MKNQMKKNAPKFKTTTNNIQKNLTTNTYRLRKVINGTKIDVSFKKLGEAKEYLNMLMKGNNK